MGIRGAVIVKEVEDSPKDLVMTKVFLSETRKSVERGGEKITVKGVAETEITKELKEHSKIAGVRGVWDLGVRDIS